MRSPDLGQRRRPLREPRIVAEQFRQVHERAEHHADAGQIPSLPGAHRRHGLVQPSDARFHLTRGDLQHPEQCQSLDLQVGIVTPTRVIQRESTAREGIRHVGRGFGARKRDPSGQ